VLRYHRHRPRTAEQFPGAVLSAGTEKFIGRRWALERIHDWWQQSADPVLVITGGPGVGKTSLIKEWVRKIHRSSSGHTGPAIHAVQYAAARTDTGHSVGLLKALSAQLAENIPAYRELLQRQSDTEQHYHFSPIQLIEHNEGNVIGVQAQVLIGHRFRLEDYRRLILAPFEKLRHEGRLPAAGVTVVLDGLDEVAVDRDDDCSFAEAVADDCSAPGLRFLLTTRTVAATSPLRRFPAFDLISDEPSASHDLANFADVRLALLPEPLRGRLLGRVVAYCAGQFVLARALIDHIENAYRAGAAPAELAGLVELPPPAGIAPAWRTLLNKFGRSDHLRDFRYLPVLRIAALARDDGLPGELLRAAVARHRPDLQPQIDNILDELRDFFRHTAHRGAPYRLCHVSLEEYLIDFSEYSSGSDFTVAQGHFAIAQVLGESTRWNGSDDEVARYARKHLLTHLVAAVPADREAAQQMSQELLGQPDFINAVMCRLGVERFQWELERLAAAFDHQVWPVNDLAFLLSRQTAQLRNIRSETDEGFLLRQLLHAARASGADSAESYHRRLVTCSLSGLETIWATGGRELTSCVRMFEHGHAPVSAVAIVDECRFVTASDDGTASIWDVRTAQRRCLPGDGSRIRTVAASPGWVLSGNGRGTIEVWNAATDTPGPPLPRLPGPVLALAVLTDGERGVSLSADGSVRAWRLRNPREFALLTAHRLDRVAREAYRPTIMAVAAEHVLTAAANGHVVVTDLRNTSQQLVLRHPGDELTAAALSPDGHHAVTGGADGSVILWDLVREGRLQQLPDGRCSRNLRADAGDTQPADNRITALVIGRGGRFVVAGSSVGARLWDTARNAGELLTGDSGVSALTLVPGDRQVVTASLDHRLRLWSLHSRRLLHLFLGHRDRVRSLVVDASGRRMISASYDGTARLWHVPVTAEREVLQGHSARPTAMSVTVDRTGLVVADAGGTIWRRNLVDGQGEKPRRISPSRVTALLPATRGRQLAVGTADGVTGIWNLDDATFVRTVGTHSARVTALVAMPDERMVVTYADGLARLWHRRTAESLRIIRHHSGFTAAAATMLGDAPAVLLAAEDHTVRLWDIESGTWRWEHAGHAMKVLSIAVCENNEYAVTAALDGTVRRWRISDGMSRALGPPHQAEATTVATGPAMLAVSGAQDGSAIVWDLRECTARHHLEHGAAVTAVAFTQNGLHIVTGSSDGGIRLWDIGDMAGRRLTHPRVRLMLDGQVTQLLVAPTGDRTVAATATGQLTCVKLP
jgi:WD40 repeat protein